MIKKIDLIKLGGKFAFFRVFRVKTIKKEWIWEILPRIFFLVFLFLVYFVLNAFYLSLGAVSQRIGCWSWLAGIGFEFH